MPSITGATAVYQLAIQNLYNTPQQLQGFAADDVFSTDAIDSAEVLMGVDGFMSAGFVYVPIKQAIMLQSDSASNDIFDNWWEVQQSFQDVYFANAVVQLKTLEKKWTLTRGVLSGYTPIPQVKKLVQPRKFEITWNSVSPSPV